jgi:hypothetical protein|eukprot:m.16751 g.16751  ORF g.16751 m.16751 type:complete len:296 (+) comp9101_c0_seq1:194-1081(+)
MERPSDGLADTEMMVTKAEAMLHNKLRLREVTETEFEAMQLVNARAMSLETSPHAPAQASAPSLPAVTRAPREIPTRHVPEHILFVLDLSAQHRGVFAAVKQSLNLLVQTKARMGKDHTFGLATIGAEFLTILDFTQNVKDLCSTMNLLETGAACGSLDLNECLDGVLGQVDLSELACNRGGQVGRHIVRVVVIHSRTKVDHFPTGKARTLLASPSFYLDMVHIVPKQVKGSDDLMRDHLLKLFPDPHYYIHSLLPNPRLFQPCIAALASHALIRPDRSFVQYGLDTSKATHAQT